MYSMSLPTACSCSVSVLRLCLSTVCHFCAHVRLRIVLYLRAWLSAPTTWLSLPSRFRNRSWQGWGKQIIKKHCCPPQGKIRTASPYGVSSACQSGLPWCYLQLFLLSPIPPRVMCGQLFEHEWWALSVFRVEDFLARQQLYVRCKTILEKHDFVKDF